MELNTYFYTLFSFYFFQFYRTDLQSEDATFTLINVQVDQETVPHLHANARTTSTNSRSTMSRSIGFLILTVVTTALVVLSPMHLDVFVINTGSFFLRQNMYIRIGKDGQKQPEKSVQGIQRSLIKRVIPCKIKKKYSYLICILPPLQNIIEKFTISIFWG